MSSTNKRNVARKAAPKKKTTHVDVHVKSRVIEAPSQAPSQADAKAFERGHSMAVDFVQEFDPGELKSALQGFTASCRERLTEQMRKHDNLAMLAGEALDVVEER